MVYPKDIRDKIAEGIKNKQSAQEILCKLILWQYSDIETTLKEKLKKQCIIENFLSSCLKIDISELKRLLEKREIYKNVPMKDLNSCINCG